ncbi:MAG: succinate dehydrogenase [Paracoccaceae bacterium]
MLDLHLYMLQRISALIMVPLVLVHIVVMIIAIQGGLSVAEILGRTQGSVFWFLFYGLFVLAVSVHGAIGLRVVVHEWGGLRGTWLTGFTWATFGLLGVMGARAVWAVTFA